LGSCADLKQDGPSAGMAHTIALISLFSGKPVPPTMAMTVSDSSSDCLIGFSNAFRAKSLFVVVLLPSEESRKN
jgi:hypothetical protein